MAGKFKKDRRDPGRFILMPVPVVESAAYRALGSSARALLWDIATQYKGDNNGRLLAGWTFMSEERGWRGTHTLQRAKTELLASASLVVETRMGMRPNRSAWFACTWWPLDWVPQMEMAEQAFPRGAYKNARPCVVSANCPPPIDVKTANCTSVNLSERHLSGPDMALRLVPKRHTSLEQPISVAITAA